MGNNFSSSDEESADEAKERDKKTPKKKTKKEKKEKKDKKKLKESDKGRYTAIRPFETQIVGRVDLAAAGVPAAADGSFQNGSVAGSILNSMLIAQRNFSESLKQVQNEEQPLITLSKLTHFDLPTLRSLQSVFQAISCYEGNDNLISASELCKSCGARPDSLLGRALFRLLDITRSNNINFRTWVLMLSKLSPHASLDDKIGFAFNLYDGDGDGYIDKAELVAMLRQAITDLSEDDAAAMITHAFEQADADNDHRINLSDYRLMASGSQDFAEAFTIDVPSLLAHYNVISADEAQQRVGLLRERDLRQDEKMNTPAQQAKEKAFMEQEEDDLHVVVDVDTLDIE